MMTKRFVTHYNYLIYYVKNQNEKRSKQFLTVTNGYYNYILQLLSRLGN